MSVATIQERPDIIGDDELYEVIDGQRVRTKPMGVYAVWTAFQLARHLGNFAAASDVGRVLTEALFHLPAPVNRDRRPDLAFVSYARWPRSRSVPRRDSAWDVVPNLVTEVVSPTDVVEELEVKIVEYFRAGVQLVWVVHPMQSTIHVYTSPTKITVVTMAETLDGGAVVPGFQLPLDQLFTEPVETSAGTNGESRTP